MLDPIRHIRFIIKMVFSKEYVVAPVVLLLISLIVFRGQFSGASYAIYPDNTYMYLPLLAHASRVFNAGEYPYWINTIVGGIPLYDTPQFTVDYPLYFLRSGVYGTALEACFAIHLITLLHYYILLLNSFILFRVLGVGMLAALTGATSLSFSANMVSYFFGVTMLAPYSWLPLFIAALIVALRGVEVFRPFFLGVFAIVMMVLSAPSLPFIHCCFISAVVVAFFVMSCLWSRQFVLLWRGIGVVGTIGIVAFLIVSPYLVAEIQSMPGFIRWIGESALVGKTQMPFNAYLLGQMSPIHLFDPIFPFKGKHLIGNPFIGWGGVFLIFLSVNRFKQLPILLPFFCLMVWGFLSSFGSNFGLAFVNYRIPFLNLMREPGRHLFIFIFSASILIAHGIDYLVVNRQKEWRYFLSRYNVSAFLILSISSLAGPFVFGIPVDTEYVALTLSAIAAFPLYLLVRSCSTRMYVLSGLSIIMVSTTLNYYYFIRIPINEGDYFDRWNLTSHNVLEEISKIDGIHNYRVVFQESKREQFWSMNGSYYDIRSFSAYFNPLPNEQFSQLFYQGHSFENYRELLGTRYVVCRQCDERSLKNYTLERELSGYKLFRTDKAFPRYKVVHQIEGAYEDSSQFYARLGAGYDYLNRIQVRREDMGRLVEHLQAAHSEPSCVLKEEHSSYNTLVISGSCESPGIFVLNEYFNPNWSVRLNGRPTDIYRVNLNQIGVPLKQGGVLIEIEYKPRLFYWLRCCSQGAVSILLVVFLILLIERIRQKIYLKNKP